MSVSRRVWILISLLAGGLSGCHGTPPVLAVEGTGQIPAVAFGRVIVGETAIAPFMVENVAGDAFQLTGSPSIGGVNASDFQVVAAPPATVGELLSVSGTLSFSPSAAGARSGQVSIPTNLRGMPSLTGSLSGTAVPTAAVTLAADPTSEDFGQVEITATATLPLRITNTGIDAAPLQPLRITGPDAAAYAFSIAGQPGSSQPSAPLAPGASLKLSVTFTPPALGTKTAALQIQACRLCAPIAVPLTGIGFTPGLAFLPPVLNFSGIGRQQSQTQFWTLTNQGNASTSVLGLAFVDGGSPFSFDFGSKTAISLAPGQNFTFQVTYAPLPSETPGEMDQAVIAPLTSGADIEVMPGVLTATVALNCQLQVPASLFFGFAEPPYFSPSRTLTISNAGADDCPVSQFAFAPGSDPDFGFLTSPPASLTIPGGGSAGLALIFAPTTVDAALHQATLTMKAGEPGLASLSVLLSGEILSGAYQKGSPWPKRCHDNGNTCLSEVDTSKTRPNLQWKTYIAGFAYNGSGPAIDADGTIYQCGVDGTLNALSRGGIILWSSFATGPWQEAIDVSVPAVRADGEVVVLINSQDNYGDFKGANQYFGFDGADGGPLWAEPTASDTISSSPSLGPGETAMFLVGDARTPLAETGIEAFAQERARPLIVCPLCAGDGVVAPDGTSYWWSASTGSVAAAGLSVIRQIFVDGGTGFVLPAAVNCGSTTVQMESTEILSGTNLYLAGTGTIFDGGNITALGVFDVSNAMRLEWQYCEENFQGNLFALGPDGGAILRGLFGLDDAGGGFETSSSGFAWVDPPGVERWENQSPVDGTPTYGASPAVGAEGTVYAAASMGPLVAISGADGGVLWSYPGGQLGVAPSSLAIGSDGTVYFMDIEGFLNALR